MDGIHIRIMSEWGLLDLRTMEGNHDLHHRDGELDKPEEVPDKTPEIVKSVTSFVQSMGLLPPQPMPTPQPQDGEGNQEKGRREEQGEEEGDQEDVGASDDEAKEENQLALRPWECRTIAEWITGNKEESRPINRPNGGGVILRRPVTHVEAIVYAPAGDWLAMDTFSCPPISNDVCSSSLLLPNPPSLSLFSPRLPVSFVPHGSGDGVWPPPDSLVCILKPRQWSRFRGAQGMGRGGSSREACAGSLAPPRSDLCLILLSISNLLPNRHHIVRGIADAAYASADGVMHLRGPGCFPGTILGVFGVLDDAASLHARGTSKRHATDPGQTPSS